MRMCGWSVVLCIYPGLHVKTFWYTVPYCVVLQAVQKATLFEAMLVPRTQH